RELRSRSLVGANRCRGTFLGALKTLCSYQGLFAFQSGGLGLLKCCRFFGIVTILRSNRLRQICEFNARAAAAIDDTNAVRKNFAHLAVTIRSAVQSGNLR